MRASFLKLVREKGGLDRSASADGGASAPAADAAMWRQTLECSSGLDIETYLREMVTCGPHRTGWGGFVELELICICLRWSVRAWVFRRRPPNPACELIFTTAPSATGSGIALLWSGAHWDALRLSGSLWTKLWQARPT